MLKSQRRHKLRQVYDLAYSVIKESISDNGYFSLTPIDIYKNPKDEVKNK